MISRHPAIVESFSRAQSNEWYVASRTTRPIPNIEAEDGGTEAIEVFMKMEKNDASLVDVDSELGAVVRKGE
jgi:hypothetical protein